MAETVPVIGTGELISHASDPSRVYRVTSSILRTPAGGDARKLEVTCVPADKPADEGKVTAWQCPECTHIWGPSVVKYYRTAEEGKGLLGIRRDDGTPELHEITSISTGTDILPKVETKPWTPFTMKAGDDKADGEFLRQYRRLLPQIRRLHEEERLRNHFAWKEGT